MIEHANENVSCHCLFFFVKQKTAYEMRISDWSSDVCSSDLARAWAWRGRTGPSTATTSSLKPTPRCTTPSEPAAAEPSWPDLTSGPQPSAERDRKSAV